MGAQLPVHQDRQESPYAGYARPGSRGRVHAPAGSADPRPGAPDRYHAGSGSPTGAEADVG